MVIKKNQQTRHTNRRQIYSELGIKIDIIFNFRLNNERTDANDNATEL